MSTNPTVELGPFVMPHLVEWWKQSRTEHAVLFTQIAELRGQLRKLDKQLTPLKRDHGSASQPVKSVIEKRKKAHEEVDRLEWRIHEQTKTLQSFDTILNTAIQPYARSSCHALTSVLHRTFPRELRDMVYDHLLDDDTANSIGDQVRHQVEHVLCKRHSCPHEFKPLHFLDPDFVSPDFSSEILPVAAKKCSRLQKSAYAVRDLTSFLKLHALDPVVDTPVLASEFFRDLTIRVSHEDMPYAWRMAQTGGHQPTATPTFETVYDLLSSITPRNDRTLTIRLEGTSMDGENSIRCRSLLEPTLQAIGKAGFKEVVALWVSRHGPWRKTVMSRYVPPPYVLASGDAQRSWSLVKGASEARHVMRERSSGRHHVA